MKLIYIPVLFLAFISLLSFASKNMQAVELHYYLGFVWQAPLSLMLLITFTLGVIAGILAFIGLYIRQRSEIIALKKELKQLNPHQND